MLEKEERLRRYESLDDLKKLIVISSTNQSLIRITFFGTIGVLFGFLSLIFLVYHYLFIAIITYICELLLFLLCFKIAKQNDLKLNLYLLKYGTRR